MPAFAALIALHWERLPLWGFRMALFLQILVLSLLFWVGANLQFSGLMEEASTWTYSDYHWIFMAGSIVIVLVGLLRRNHSKTLALAGCFLIYCALTSSLAPLEGQLGRYSAATITQLQGKDVWVPCDFRAKDEEYRLLLPGAKLHGYVAKDAAEVAKLISSYPIVALQTPLGSKPELCDSCQIVGQRMEMRARHSYEEIMEMLQGQVGKHLFVNEYLVVTSVATPVIAPDLSNVKDVCR
jgi:hypothetical protein